MRGSPSQNRDPRRRESRRGAIPMSMLPSCNSFQPVSRVCSPSSRFVPVSSIFLLAQVCFSVRWSSVLCMTKPRKTYFIKYDFLGFFFYFPTLALQRPAGQSPLLPRCGSPAPVGRRVVPSPGCAGTCARVLKWEVACSRPSGVYLGAVWLAGGLFPRRIEQKMSFVKFVTT